MTNNVHLVIVECVVCGHWITNEVGVPDDAMCVECRRADNLDADDFFGIDDDE